MRLRIRELAHDEWEMLPSVPRIKLEREPQGAALLAACLKSKNRELHPAVVIAINTGLRLSELLGLTRGFRSCSATALWP